MNSISIKTGMLIISVLTLVLSLVMGVLALEKMKVMNNGSIIFYEDVVPGVTQAEEMNVAVADMRVSAAEHLMQNDESSWRESEQEIATAENLFIKNYEAYKNAVPPHAKDELEEVDAIDNQFKQYTALTEKFIAFSRSGNHAEASQLYVGEMIQLYDAIGKAMNALIERNTKDGTEVNTINEATYEKAKLLLRILTAILVLNALMLILFSQKGVIRPILNISKAMTVLAGGDTESSIPYIENTNEMGTMAKAVQVFKDNMLKNRAMEAEQAEQKKRAEADRRAVTLKMADDLESAVGKVIQTVSSASTQMQSSAQVLSRTAEGASQQTNQVAETTRVASGNVQTVAAATEELSSSILEISSQINRSAKFSGDSVVAADQMNTKIQGLVEAVHKIGSVIDIINNIASQINLLALNATIEAARAGEAGKGFAVVASEVKALAAGTAKATDEISGLINSIQGATQDSASSITTIISTINEMDKISQSIAAAVEEQSAATKDISRNVQQAASGTEEVVRNIVDVSRATQETGAAASEILAASDSLAAQADVLRNQIDQFLIRVRAG